MDTETNNNGFWRSPGFRTGLRIVVLIVLLLVLLVPLHMVRSIVRERERRHAQTVEEIVTLQGGRQELIGPLVSIPITERYLDDEGIARFRVRDVLVVSEAMEATVTLDPELLSRGIYEVPVYEAGIEIGASVTLPSAEEISFAGTGVQQIHWNEAVLVLGIHGVSGLRTAPSVTVDGLSSEVESGGGGLSSIRTTFEGDAPSRGAYERGFSVVLPNAGPGTNHDIALSLALSGGRSFHAVPTAEHSSIVMESGWTSPSFTGDLLPSSRSLSEDGFSAEWEMTALGMGMPDLWIGGATYPEWLETSRVGVALFQPVNHYQQTLRSVKYGVLFLLLPFVALFLLEMLTGASIHPVQYLLIAAAKIVFYLLLLSLSEHIPFVAAYWSGATATVVLATLYVAAFLRRKSHAFLLGGMIAAEYVFLFSALQSEDYALLIGSVGLFALLAAVMMATRRIDWCGGVGERRVT